MCAYFRKPDNPCSQALALVLFKKDRYRGQSPPFCLAHRVDIGYHLSIHFGYSFNLGQIMENIDLISTHLDLKLMRNPLSEAQQLKLTPKQLQNYLVKTIANPAIRTERRDYLLKKKTEMKSSKLRNKQFDALWRDLLRDLKYELANAMVGRRYKSTNPTPERDQAFDRYIEVLQRLEHKIKTNYMTTYVNDDGEIVEPELGTRMTPSQFSAWVQRRNPKAIPNNGSHWTDWVPRTQRQEVSELFELIPTMPRMKRKLPFQRMSRPPQESKARASKIERLKLRTENELVNAEQAHEMNPTDKHLQTVRKIKQALRWIDELKPNDFVPPTWHGMYPETE